MQIEPSPSAFAANYARGMAQVVWTTLVADLETPVSAFIDPPERPVSDRVEKFVAVIEGAADEIAGPQHRQKYGRSVARRQSRAVVSASVDARSNAAPSGSGAGVGLARLGFHLGDQRR